MSTKKTIKEEFGAPPAAAPQVTVEMPPELTSVLQRLGDKLDKLDVSIDYLSAAITGEDPLSISIGQSVGGRLVAPRRRKGGMNIEEAKKAVTDLSESSLLQLIREEFKGMLKENVSRADTIFEEAGLSQEEIERVVDAIAGDNDGFHGSPEFQKLYEYFAFRTKEMPYGVAKAQEGDPDTWILDYLYDLQQGEQQGGEEGYTKLNHPTAKSHSRMIKVARGEELD